MGFNANRPRLGFILWRRRLLKRFRSYLQRVRIGTILNLSIGLIALYFANIANELSKASYKLASNDTAQQQQINKLSDILSEVRKENQSLVDLVKSNKRQNELSSSMIGKLEYQLAVSNQQFALAKKNDSLSDYKYSLDYEKDYLSFKEAYEDLFSIPTIFQFGSLHQMPNKQKLDFLKNVSSKFQSQFRNSFYLSNPGLKKIWYDYTSYINSNQFDLNLYITGSNRDVIKDDNGLIVRCKAIMNEHLRVYNLLLKAMNQLETEYRMIVAIGSLNDSLIRNSPQKK